MAKYLVIVESPNKVGKIQKFLGSDYKVAASVGHIMQIPKKGLGVDVANGFIPNYEVSPDKKDVVKNIKDLAKKSEKIYLATDPDREGEGISRDLYDILSKEDQKKCSRITYKEITKKAILKAIENPSQIDMNLADAQKARQVLDRLIGYKISPLLWNEVASKTSAGRVQSVALKIIAEREKEIKAFKPEDFWYIDADLKCKEGDFSARVITTDKDNRILKENESEQIYKELEKAKYAIEKVEREDKEVKANPPFDTASLQTTASSVLGWATKKTAQVSQHLYEEGLCFLPDMCSVNVIDKNNSQSWLKAFAQQENIKKLEDIEKPINVMSLRSFRKTNDWGEEGYDLDRVIVKAIPFKNEYHGEIIKITLSDGRVYKVTPDHIFPVYNIRDKMIRNIDAKDIIQDVYGLIFDGYITAKNCIKDGTDLKLDWDNIVYGSEDLYYKKVIKVEKENYNGYVYCLKTSNGYFIADNGLWTHNCSYIRTDSFAIEEDALTGVRGFIEEGFDKKYLPAKANVYKKKEASGSQEAHECIRPTDINNTGDDLVGENQRLYKLIRDRFIACQMSPAIVGTTTYTIKTNTPHKLIAKGKTIKFDGWTKAYKYTSAKDEILPTVADKEILTLNELKKTKNSTQPPPRYNDGSLTKKLEKDGVGRPSTYPTIIDGIKTRGYVDEVKGKKGSLPLQATELGLKVYEYLQNNFNDFIMDIHFTATLEEDLDVIGSGTKKYLDVVSGTYDIMMKKIGGITHGKSIDVNGEETENIDVKCTVCKNGTITQKKGKFGVFFSCDQYPECKTIYIKDSDGKFVVKGANGTNSSQQPKNVLKEECEDCKKNNREGHLVEKKGKFGVFYGCSSYPKCHAIYTKNPDGQFVRKK